MFECDEASGCMAAGEVRAAARISLQANRRTPGSAQDQPDAASWSHVVLAQTYVEMTRTRARCHPPWTRPTVLAYPSPGLPPPPPPDVNFVMNVACFLAAIALNSREWGCVGQLGLHWWAPVSLKRQGRVGTVLEPFEFQKLANAI